MCKGEEEVEKEREQSPEQLRLEMKEEKDESIQAISNDF